MTYTSSERKAYYLRNREKYLAYSREYTAKRRDKYLEYYRQYNITHTKQVEMQEQEPKDFYLINIEGKKMEEEIPSKKITKKKNNKYCDICDMPICNSDSHVKSQSHIIRAQSQLSKQLRAKKMNEA
jgi:hypothetical protein